MTRRSRRRSSTGSGWRLAIASLMLGAAPPAAVNDALIQSDALPAKLSEWRLFAGGQPNAGVQPYTLSTPLFSDYAEKLRYLYLPANAKLTWKGDGLPGFPTGSVLIKSFGYPADMRRPDEKVRMLETRLLVKRASGWIALPYVWDDDGQDATLKRAGTRIDVAWVHTDGKPRAQSYAVPNANQCKGCHDLGGQITPIGPKARNIASGLGAPHAARPLPKWDDEAAPLESRARAYLDVNCAHCHNRAGPADTSGLWLDWDQPPGPNLGILKRPTAAGRGSGNALFAIQPGSPEASIMIGRMRSLDPGIAMPELGRASVHEEGVALLSRWISQMPRAAQP